MQVKTKAVMMVVGAALLWSSGGFLVKWVDWSALSIAGSRCIIAAFFLCLYLRRLPRFVKKPVFWLNALCYAGLVTNFVLATKLTTAANAIFIQYMAPVYVALLAPFILKEPTRGKDWIFIIIAIAGMALFFMDGLTLQGLEGNLIAIASGFCFALFNMTLRRIPKENVSDAVVWGNVLAFIICLPFFDFANLPDAQGWMGIFILGAVQLGLAYYLFTQASVHLAALELTVIPIIEPILNPIIVALFIGEVPGKWAIVGGIIVLTTITTWSVIKVKEKPAPASS